MGITHSTVATTPDDGVSEVDRTAWNDDHDVTASDIPIVDAANDFTATEVEGALAELQSDAETHAAASDPHTGYRLESADHTHATTGAQGGTVAHSALTGLTTGDPHTQYVLEATAQPFSVGGVMVGAPPANGFIMVWRAPFACTVTNVRGHAKGGTNAVVNARKNQTSDFLSSDLTVGTMNAWADGGTVQNTSIAAGDDIEIELVSTSGAITEVTIQVDLTRALA